MLTSVGEVGAAAGAEPAAAELVAGLRDRLAAVAGRVAGLPAPAVTVIEWTDPPFSAGHWVPDLVTAAGGRPAGGAAGGRSAQVSWDEVAAAAPDVIVVAPCGFGLDAAAGQAGLVARRMPGVPVWAIDAGGLVVRPGPRVVDGVETIAAILHPCPAQDLTGRARRVA